MAQMATEPDTRIIGADSALVKVRVPLPVPLALPAGATCCHAAVPFKVTEYSRIQSSPQANAVYIFSLILQSMWCTKRLWGY